MLSFAPSQLWSMVHHSELQLTWQNSPLKFSSQKLLAASLAAWADVRNEWKRAALAQPDDPVPELSIPPEWVAAVIARLQQPESFK